jgi:hypothetical protein
VADDLDREVQLEELRADLRELATRAPGVVDAIDVAIEKLTLARAAVEELGHGAAQVAQREILNQRNKGE